MSLLTRLAALALLAWGLGLAWFAVTLPRPAPLASATDAVVVLTGGRLRLARGLEVLQYGSAGRMLVSGVHRKVDKSELSEASAVPRALFAAKVDLGMDAVDTHSNAAETARWVAAHRYRSLRLITSAAHMRRAELEMRARLPADIALLTDPVAVDEGAVSLGREYTKYLLRRGAVAAGL